MKVSAVLAAFLAVVGFQSVSVSQALNLRSEPVVAPHAPVADAPSETPAAPAEQKEEAAAPAAVEPAADKAVEPAQPETNPSDASPAIGGVDFNKIAPFGKENTAKELQDHASKTQDTLVDAVEEAEIAEIKRAVFRALTRLRAATIKEFDTIARLQTQSIDQYNDEHHYRNENPISHLHEDESPVETDKLQSFH
eukprot:GDKI01021460.1.p1 GENE.GDKI01021460.1~~GDKI01021460.1.p1  ORF type:complete len:195 (-),score=78.61 GDKI01021460.1:346-930(-)